MKTIIKIGILVFILSPNTISANTTSRANSISIVKTPRDTTEVITMLRRLDNIYRMDKSGLKKDEKKELRNEVKAIKSKLKTNNYNGIYLSGGAIIIIVILLIILL